MPRITISYRRDDSLDITGRIFDRLAAHFGREAVFRDIDNIPPGADFRHHIDRVLDESDIILAIVGPRWIGPRANQSRLESAADPVRLEIETALRKGKPLVPVLVSRAAMPRPDQLPDTLHDFAYRNAVQVDSSQNFENDVRRLIRAMERMSGVDAGGVASEEIASGVTPTQIPEVSRPRGDDDAVLDQDAPHELHPKLPAEVEALRETNRVLEDQMRALNAELEKRAHQLTALQEEMANSRRAKADEVNDLAKQLNVARDIASSREREIRDLKGHLGTSPVGVISKQDSNRFQNIARYSLPIAISSIFAIGLVLIFMTAERHSTPTTNIQNTIPNIEPITFGDKIGVDIVANNMSVTITYVEVGSPASKANIQTGDIITQIDGKIISGTSEFTSFIAQMKSGDIVHLALKNMQGSTRSVSFRKS
jgi:hypothetical protein